MKKRMVACLMTLVMTGMLAACGNSAGEKQPVQDNSSAGTTEEMQAPAETGNAGGDTIVLKLGHIQSESDLWHRVRRNLRIRCLNSQAGR